MKNDSTSNLSEPTSTIPLDAPRRKLMIARPNEDPRRVLHENRRRRCELNSDAPGDVRGRPGCGQSESLSTRHTIPELSFCDHDEDPRVA
jgi:hypothetical protein